MQIDRINYDNKLALKIFSIAALLFLLSAMLRLNVYPFHASFSAFSSGKTLDMYERVSGYSFLFLTIFWASRFSLFSQRLLFVLTPISAAVLLYLLPTDWEFTFEMPKQTAMTFLFVAMAIPAFFMLLWRAFASWSNKNDSEFELRFRYLIMLSLLFTMVPDSALSLSSSLHPHTFDLFAMQWDALVGLNIAPQLSRFVDPIFGGVELISLAYSLTPLAFLAVALLHLRGKPEHTASAILTWVVLTSCAVVAYHFFPITGPKYVFGSDNYLLAVENPFDFGLDLVRVPPAPRNGMPSMHFGWMLASSLLWWRTGTRWWSRTIIILMTILTAVATLVSGEHYGIDLIVAVPFVLASIALSTTSISWDVREKTYTVLLGFGLWLMWILVLRNLVPFAIAHTWFPWVVMVITLLGVIAQGVWMSRFPTYALKRSVSAGDEIVSTVEQKFLERRIAWLFFASGSAALIYQVLFAKKLALVFGSTSTATLTVLATFLGGMAIGSLIGGRYAQKVKLPLKTYAFIEGAIALYCVFTPYLFDAVQVFYVYLGAGYAPDSATLLLLRVSLGAMTLLVPTILMGVTLPFLAEVLQAQGEKLGAKVALLYFANTAGATLGAILTSYFIIPLVGVNSTTRIAALVNLLVALAAIELAKKFSWSERIPVEITALEAKPQRKSAVVCAILVLGFGGLVSLGLEVVYVHMLSIVAGNSVYAFGLMLATFLMGLAIGSALARKIMQIEKFDRLYTLSMSLLGLSLSLGLGMWFWNELPNYFASFSEETSAKNFVFREAIRAIVCAITMLPPTLFIGASYVFAMDVVTQRGSIKMLGIGAAFNTLGNILGVLLFGFLLLPILGGLGATQVLTCCALFLSVIVVMIARTRLRNADYALFALAGLCAALSFQMKLDYNILSSGANVYFTGQKWGEAIDHAESIDGGLTTVTVMPRSETSIKNSGQKGDFKTLLTNGKFQGNNIWEGEMQAQFGFAFASLMHQEQRDRALVIGYGTGVTSRVFHEAGFRHVDIAELSGDVVNMANKHFSDVNGLASKSPNVNMHITDGRNLLLLSPSANLYDVISIEITSIWFAGASALYNQEFYALAKSKMKTDGVLQQWVQLHHLSPMDMLTIVATLRSEFKYVSLYVIGSQGILIASNAESRKSVVASAIDSIKTMPSLEAIRQKFTTKMEDLESTRLLNNEELDRLLQSMGAHGKFLISTDDNLKLEYSTPKGNVLDAKSSFDAIMHTIAPFSQSPIFKKKSD